MEDRLHKRTVKINKNKGASDALKRPSKMILPPDLFNDIYDEIKANGGSTKGFETGENIQLDEGDLVAHAALSVPAELAGDAGHAGRRERGEDQPLGQLGQ